MVHKNTIFKKKNRKVVVVFHLLYGTKYFSSMYVWHYTIEFCITNVYQQFSHTNGRTRPFLSITIQEKISWRTDFDQLYFTSTVSDNVFWNEYLSQSSAVEGKQLRLQIRPVRTQVSGNHFAIFILLRSDKLSFFKPDWPMSFAI